MTKSQPAGSYDAPLVDRGRRGGTVLRLLLLALVLIGVSIAFVIFKGVMDNEVMLGILGVLAMVGIFFIVSSIIGLVEVMPQSRSDEFAGSYLASHPDGILITDPRGRILYANSAYGRLTGATKAANAQSLEALLSKNREATEALYRLTATLREGRDGHEEFRLLKPLGRNSASGSGAHWYRLKARLLTSPQQAAPLDVWQIADITSEREEQERFFRELQNAIDYLDHAPAGFFSAGKKGEVFYLNATLAEWLGLDLTKFAAGSMTMADMVAGEGMALIQSVQAGPGQTRTETLDLDLRRANGQSLPVRLVHSVSSMRDGAPGESRTIVLARGRRARGRINPLPPCGLPASSTTRPWRLPRLAATGAFFASTRRSFGCLRASCPVTRWRPAQRSMRSCMRPRGPIWNGRSPPPRIARAILRRSIAAIPAMKAAMCASTSMP